VIPWWMHTTAEVVGWWFLAGLAVAFLWMLVKRWTRAREVKQWATIRTMHRR
jgi:hypothetical protein